MRFNTRPTHTEDSFALEVFGIATQIVKERRDLVNTCRRVDPIWDAGALTNEITARILARTSNEPIDDLPGYCNRVLNNLTSGIYRSRAAKGRDRLRRGWPGGVPPETGVRDATYDMYDLNQAARERLRRSIDAAAGCRVCIDSGQDVVPCDHPGVRSAAEWLALSASAIVSDGRGYRSDAVLGISKILNSRLRRDTEWAATTTNADAGRKAIERRRFHASGLAFAAVCSLNNGTDRYHRADVDIDLAQFLATRFAGDLSTYARTRRGSAKDSLLDYCEFLRTGDWLPDRAA